MRTIFGHERQIQYLEKVLKNGRLAHAYLFYGPERVGKYTVAGALAKAFHCSSVKNPSLEVCNRCPQCVLIDQGTHPHVFVLDTAHTLVSKKEKRKEIPIEDIRELKRILSFAPEGEQWRIAIINNAETMSQEAANAFLKILEEPGAQTLLILVSAHPDLLPPTIISRTQPIRFSFVAEEKLRVPFFKRREDQKTQAEMLRVAAGRPGVLLRFLHENGYWEQEKKFVESIAVVRQRHDIPAAFRLSEKIANDEGLREKGIEYMLRTLHADLLECVFRERPIPKALLETIQHVEEVALRLATTNVNPRLAFDVLFLDFLHIPHQ